MRQRRTPTEVIGPFILTWMEQSSTPPGTWIKGFDPDGFVQITTRAGVGKVFEFGAAAVGLRQDVFDVEGLAGDGARRMTVFTPLSGARRHLPRYGYRDAGHRSRTNADAHCRFGRACDAVPL